VGCAQRCNPLNGFLLRMAEVRSCASPTFGSTTLGCQRFLVGLGLYATNAHCFEEGTGCGRVGASHALPLSEDAKHRHILHRIASG
jgi:hypothetical protein